MKTYIHTSAAITGRDASDTIAGDNQSQQLRNKMTNQMLIECRTVAASANYSVRGVELSIFNALLAIVAAAARLRQ